MTPPFAVARLAERDAEALDAFLAALPRSHLFLRAAGRNAGPSSFVAARSNGRIAAVAQSGAPSSLVVAGDPAGISAIARGQTPRVPWRVLVGRGEETSAWLAADSHANAVSRRHRYLALDAIPLDEARGLRPAGDSGGERVERAAGRDLDDIVRLSFAFHRDDDPAGAAPREPKSVEARNRARIAAGTCFVVKRDGVPVFMADVGVEEPTEGALLGGIVTDPEWRRRGIARAGLVAVCRRLFERGIPSIALHVAEENAAARGLYAGIGFREIDVFRVAYAR